MSPEVDLPLRLLWMIKHHSFQFEWSCWRGRTLSSCTYVHEIQCRTFSLRVLSSTLYYKPVAGHLLTFKQGPHIFATLANLKRIKLKHAIDSSGSSFYQFHTVQNPSPEQLIIISWLSAKFVYDQVELRSECAVRTLHKTVFENLTLSLFYASGCQEMQFLYLRSAFEALSFINCAGFLFFPLFPELV